MNVNKYSDEFLERLVRSFVAYSAEQTWFEFKRTCTDLMRIGKYLSGLSNAALLANQPYGYLVYGIDNLTHEIVGTSFDPMCEKTKGRDSGEELINYIQRGLHENSVSYDVFSIEGRYPNIYAAAVVAKRTGNEAGYLGVKGFDTKFYKQRVLEFICLKKQASAKEIFDAVKSFLPTGRTLADNKKKISGLLSVVMSTRERLIKTAVPHTSKWVLTQKGVEVCKSGNVSCRRKCPTC